MDFELSCISREGFGATWSRRALVSLLTVATLAIGFTSLVPASRAATPATFTVFTSKAAFEAALDAASPNTRFNVNWDGIPFNGESRTKAIPANQFVARQILLDTENSPNLLVSNVNFGDVRANYAGNFPTFSPTINFKLGADGAQKNTFTLADRQTPALTSAFGAIFTDVEKNNVSGLVFRDQFDREIGRFFVPAGANGLNQFLGVIFSRPVAARVEVLMGERSEDFGAIDDVTNGGSADLVVTDDFIFQRGVVAIPTITRVTFRPNGVLNVDGIGFAIGARIVINGTSHDTTNNPLNPNRKLGSDEASAFIPQGQAVEIQVINPDGTLSKGVKFPA